MSLDKHFEMHFFSSHINMKRVQLIIIFNIKFSITLKINITN